MEWIQFINKLPEYETDVLACRLDGSMDVVDIQEIEGKTAYVTITDIP